jgi:hypothetical protein
MSEIQVDLVMDASNFARFNQLPNIASIEQIQRAVSQVEQSLDGRSHHLQIFADSRLQFHFPQNEKKKYAAFVKKYNVVPSATGQAADDLILGYARECFRESGRYAIVLSQDGFRQEEYDEHHEWLYERGAGRIFGGQTVGRDSLWILYERHLHAKRALKNLPPIRSLAEFLDQEFPTPRSIARELKFPVESLQDLIGESRMATSETEILTSAAATQFRNYVASVQKFTQSAMGLTVAKGLSATDVIRWLGDAKHDYFVKGDNPFVEVATATSINEWAKTPSGTIGRYWLEKAVSEKNSQDITLAVTRLSAADDNAALKVGTICGQLVENGRISDWSLLSGLTQRDSEWLLQLLRVAELQLDLDLVPNKYIDNLPTALRLWKFARNAQQDLSDENVIRYFDLLYSLASGKTYQGNDLQTEESFLLVVNAITDQFVSNSVSLKKKSWAHVADILELLEVESDIAYVAHYMAGSLEKALLGGSGCSLKTRNLLHRKFFSDELEAPWLTADVFREVAKSPDGAKQLINGDLSPLATSLKFAEVAHRSSDIVLASSTPTAVLASVLITRSTVNNVTRELNDLHDAMSNVLNSRNGK